MNFKPILVTGLLATGAMALLSAPALADASFEGQGSTVSLDCEGGAARIEGAGNLIEVTGRCTRLDLAGMDNHVTVDLVPGGRIVIKGASNTVVWTTPDDSEPVVQSEGHANAVLRAQ